MRFIKSLFLSFLVIFFVNYMFPGIEVTNKTKLPHLGMDFPFALGLGLLNALIYPIVQLFRRRSPVFQVVAIAFILNFAVYGSLSLLHIGVQIDSVRFYLLAAGVVAIASIIANLLEMREKHLPPEDTMQPPQDDLL